MSAASQPGLRDIVNFTLVAVYVAVSTVLVSVPVGIVVLAGDRADALFARGQSWLTEHASTLRVTVSLGLGVAFVADALLRMFA